MTVRERLFGPRTQLSCRQVGRLLQSHLDGELDEARSQHVANHLDDCFRCGLEAETYQAVREALARPPRWTQTGWPACKPCGQTRRWRQRAGSRIRTPQPDPEPESRQLVKTNPDVVVVDWLGTPASGQGEYEAGSEREDPNTC